MSEIFETVNTHSDLAQQVEHRRKGEARRRALANRKMNRILIGCIVVWILMLVLSGFGQISKELADFISRWAGIFLAIYFGAWFQFRFCRKGLMK